MLYHKLLKAKRLSNIKSLLKKGVQKFGTDLSSIQSEGKVKEV